MCICVHVYVCACVYVCMCICVYVHVCMCACVCMSMCVHVCMYMCLVCMCICVHVYMCASAQKPEDNFGVTARAPFNLFFFISLETSSLSSLVLTWKSPNILVCGTEPSAKLGLQVYPLPHWVIILHGF